MAGNCVVHCQASKWGPGGSLSKGRPRTATWWGPAPGKKAERGKSSRVTRPLGHEARLVSFPLPICTG